MENTKIIFDLDRTLLNTDAMKHGIAEVLGVDNLTTDFVLEKLRERDERLLSFLEEKTADYIFPGVLDKLDEIKQMGEMVLLTMGDKELQKIKVDEMRELKEKFDRILYPKDSQEKIAFFRELVEEGGEIISFNDNQEENDEFKKIYPKNIFSVSKEQNNLNELIDDLKKKWKPIDFKFK